MGESLFLAPIKRWLGKHGSIRAVKARRPAPDAWPTAPNGGGPPPRPVKALAIPPPPPPPHQERPAGGGSPAIPPRRPRKGPSPRYWVGRLRRPPVALKSPWAQTLPQRGLSRLRPGPERSPNAQDPNCPRRTRRRGQLASKWRTYSAGSAPLIPGRGPFWSATAPWKWRI